MNLGDRQIDGVVLPEQRGRRLGVIPWRLGSAALGTLLLAAISAGSGTSTVVAQGEDWRIADRFGEIAGTDPNLAGKFPASAVVEVDKLIDFSTGRVMFTSHIVNSKILSFQITPDRGRLVITQIGPFGAGPRPIEVLPNHIRQVQGWDGMSTTRVIALGSGRFTGNHQGMEWDYEGYTFDEVGSLIKANDKTSLQVDLAAASAAGFITQP